MTTNNPNRRRSPRSRTFLKGLIVYGPSKMSIPCLVRDLSSHGARLKVAVGLAVPQVFELHFPDRNEVRHARLVRVIGDELGIEYTDVAASEAPGFGAHREASLVPDAAVQASFAANHDGIVSRLNARIDELEAENVRLKRMLERLGIEA